MDSFAPGVLYNCKFCNFMASDQWHCDIHRKLTHEKLITDKTKVHLSLPSMLRHVNGLRIGPDGPEVYFRCLFQRF